MINVSRHPMGGGSDQLANVLEERVLIRGYISKDFDQLRAYAALHEGGITHCAALQYRRCPPSSGRRIYEIEGLPFPTLYSVDLAWNKIRDDERKNAPSAAQIVVYDDYDDTPPHIGILPIGSTLLRDGLIRFHTLTTMERQSDWVETVGTSVDNRTRRVYRSIHIRLSSLLDELAQVRTEAVSLLVEAETTRE